MTIAHDRNKARRFPLSIPVNCQAGFRQIRKSTFRQKMTAEVTVMRAVLQRLTIMLKAHHALLVEWAREDNWIMEVVHAADCGTTLYGKDCTCRPLTKEIWNGEPDMRKKSHELFGAFEKSLVGEKQPQEQPQDSGDNPGGDSPHAVAENTQVST